MVTHPIFWHLFICFAVTLITPTPTSTSGLLTPTRSILTPNESELFSPLYSAELSTTEEEISSEIDYCNPNLYSIQLIRTRKSNTFIRSEEEESSDDSNQENDPSRLTSKNDSRRNTQKNKKKHLSTLRKFLQ